MEWVLLAALLAAMVLTGWVVRWSRRAGHGVMLATLGVATLLWMVGLVNFLALASH